MTSAIKLNAQTNPLPSTTTLQAKPNIAKRNLNAFCYMMRFLKPTEVAQCDATCKDWKIPDRVWQVQAAHYGMTAPEKTQYKDLFKEIHTAAFGRKAWQEHLKTDPGITSPLPLQVYRTFHKLKTTHILTLIPATIGGKPTSFNTFAPLAEQAGMKLSMAARVSEKYGNEPEAKSLWVWMQKEIEPGSRNKTQAQAEQDYPNRLGKALHYTISIVAHYARHKIHLMPQKPEWASTRTCDNGKDRYGVWLVVVGGSVPGGLSIWIPNFFAHHDYGVADLVSAEVQAIDP